MISSTNTTRVHSLGGSAHSPTLGRKNSLGVSIADRSSGVNKPNEEERLLSPTPSSGASMTSTDAELTGASLGGPSQVHRGEGARIVASHRSPSTGRKAPGDSQAHASIQAGDLQHAQPAVDAPNCVLSNRVAPAKSRPSEKACSGFFSLLDTKIGMSAGGSLVGLGLVLAAFPVIGWGVGAVFIALGAGIFAASLMHEVRELINKLSFSAIPAGAEAISDGIPAAIPAGAEALLCDGIPAAIPAGAEAICDGIPAAISASPVAENAISDLENGSGRLKLAVQDSPPRASAAVITDCFSNPDKVIEVALSEPTATNGGQQLNTASWQGGANSHLSISPAAISASPILANKNSIEPLYLAAVSPRANLPILYKGIGLSLVSPRTKFDIFGRHYEDILYYDKIPRPTGCENIDEKVFENILQEFNSIDIFMIDSKVSEILRTNNTEIVLTPQLFFNLKFFHACNRSKRPTTLNQLIPQEGYYKIIYKEFFRNPKNHLPSTSIKLQNFGYPCKRDLGKAYEMYSEFLDSKGNVINFIAQQYVNDKWIDFSSRQSMQIKKEEQSFYAEQVKFYKDLIKIFNKSKVFSDNEIKDHYKLVRRIQWPTRKHPDPTGQTTDETYKVNSKKKKLLTKKLGIFIQYIQLYKKNNGCYFIPF